MFLKKRHHADIMAKLHNENDAITEEDEDSGLGAELVIDEERGSSEEQKTETHFEFSFDENNCPKLQQVSDHQRCIHFVGKDIDGSMIPSQSFFLVLITLTFQLEAAQAEVRREERVSVIKHTCDLVVEARPGQVGCGMLDSVIGESIVVISLLTKRHRSR